MENLETINTWEPEDGVNFDGTEMIEVLTAAVNEARDHGEAFPWTHVNGEGNTIRRVRLVRGDQSDGSQNYEIVLDLMHDTIN